MISPVYGSYSITLKKGRNVRGRSVASGFDNSLYDSVHIFNLPKLVGA